MSKGEQEHDDGSPVRVPAGALGPDALRGVIEAFVLREGTDYGPTELGLDEKVRQVRGQIDRGEAEIVFDPGTQTVTIVPLHR